jgi:very-short-patch-repair endonuclease
MNELKIFAPAQTMTSREIAELTGKRHSDVLRDIDNIVKIISPELRTGFIISTYVDSTGKSNRMYEMSEQSYNLVLDKYTGLARVPNRLQEEAALKAIEQVLNVTLIRQYLVGNYRIDGYDSKNNIAYEIDEPEHRYCREQDGIRQERIEKLLNCSFVRITL